MKQQLHFRMQRPAKTDTGQHKSTKTKCAELARAFGHTAHQPGTRKHQRDAVAEFALKAAQQAHDRGLSHIKAAGAQHLDLESMD